jgi:hypothetical protein
VSVAASTATETIAYRVPIKFGGRVVSDIVAYSAWSAPVLPHIEPW